MQRLRFKKTKAEKEKEDFEFDKEEYKRMRYKRTLVSPPRYATHDEPISPPRKARRGNAMDDEQEEEFRSKLSQVADEDEEFEAYIPLRWQNTQDYLHSYAEGSDDEERYAERIRSGMWEKYHPEAAKEARERHRLRDNRDSIKDRARHAAREELETEEREEKRRQSGRAEEEKDRRRESFRQYWLNPPSEITVHNILYPSFDQTIDESSVAAFLQLPQMLAPDRRRTVRDVMRVFHPDKFIGRYSPRIPAQDIAAITENVSMIARILPMRHSLPAFKYVAYANHAVHRAEECGDVEESELRLLSAEEQRSPEHIQCELSVLEVQVIPRRLSYEWAPYSSVHTIGKAIFGGFPGGFANPANHVFTELLVMAPESPPSAIGRPTAIAGLPSALTKFDDMMGFVKAIIWLKTLLRKPLHDLLARVKALDSANKQNAKRKRQDKDETLSKRHNDLASPEKFRDLDVAATATATATPPRMPYSDHLAAYPTIFRATPKNLSTNALPPNDKTYIYDRPGNNNSSEHSSPVHTPADNDNDSADPDDDVIVIRNLTPKKQYTPNKPASGKLRGGRISEAYKMTPRRRITREMLMADDEQDEHDKDGENVDKENDKMQS
ncbi:hypothetical protein E3P99_01828 [Wallemia hederae]|uniref:Uncharacterized protein n=1 Tax=Wallemia hederae TaxID=1540922 RepID=A0A4T0FPW0_9BASI|nr:hypothetical protein E3P99_01828 [Wallemia hederae]